MIDKTKSAEVTLTELCQNKIPYISFWRNDIGGTESWGSFTNYCIQRHRRRLFSSFVAIRFPLTNCYIVNIVQYSFINTIYCLPYRCHRFVLYDNK